MSKTFTATVTTVLYNGNSLELHDRMIFANVDQAFIDYLFGSCKTTLNKLIRFETNKAEVAWHLHYHTKIVDDAGTVISDRPMIAFPPMSKEQVYKFMTMAIAELSEANYIRYSDFSDDKPVMKKEFWLWKLAKILVWRR